MKPQRPMRLMLAAALSAMAFGLAAQPVDPATAPVADAAAEPTVAEEAADRNCLRHTGSRLTADARPETDADGNREQRRTRCAIAPGTVYTREDLENTGHGDVGSALRSLDPRVF